MMSKKSAGKRWSPWDYFVKEYNWIEGVSMYKFIVTIKKHLTGCKVKNLNLEIDYNWKLKECTKIEKIKTIIQKQ